VSALRVVFPTSGQRVGIYEVPWIPNRSLNSYLKEPEARRARITGLHLNGGYFITNQLGEKVRLSYVPKPDDEIIFVKRAK
jgi:hypothetical protein